MPQLDILTFLNQVSFTYLFFIILLYLFSHYILPNLLLKLKAKFFILFNN